MFILVIFLSFSSLLPWTSGIKNIHSSFNTEISINQLQGKFKLPKSNLLLLKKSFASRNGLYVTVSTAKALEKMSRDIQKVGFQLIVNSATRNFKAQKKIWDGKFSGKRKVAGLSLLKSIPNKLERIHKILRYSSMPGTSRHHWGTDIDLGFVGVGNMFKNSTFSRGRGLRFYLWLKKNAKKYGFCQPYRGNPEERLWGKAYGYRGYQEERWHWSYRPEAILFMETYLKKKEKIKQEGFAGAKIASHLAHEYIMNVDQSCLNQNLLPN